MPFIECYQYMGVTKHHTVRTSPENYIGTFNTQNIPIFGGWSGVLWHRRYTVVPISYSFQSKRYTYILVYFKRFVGSVKFPGSQHLQVLTITCPSTPKAFFSSYFICILCSPVITCPLPRGLWCVVARVWVRFTYRVSQEYFCFAEACCLTRGVGVGSWNWFLVTNVWLWAFCNHVCICL